MRAGDYVPSVIPRALTIAGSDSGGGAGIQADLKAFAACGVYGMSVLTALTAQNTVGVQGVYEIPPEFVAQQIDSVLTDIGADAVKTGMLASAAIIETVAERLRRYGTTQLVVDPVMVAKSGDPLLAPEAVETLRQALFPLARLVTPNRIEAGVLVDGSVQDMSDMCAAAKAIQALGPAAVLVKGGHLEGPAVDLLYDGRDFHEFMAERISTRNTHGTGCTYASAIAAELAKGRDMLAAIAAAKTYVTETIRHSLSMGQGQGPLHHLFPLLREAARYNVLASLNQALERLAKGEVGRLIPEVQSNLGYALPAARSVQEVAAFPGRIVRLGNGIRTLAAPQFGASSHIARIILTAMGSAPEKRSVMNIRYNEAVLAACRRLDFATAYFDRAEEPEDIRWREGSSLEWGTAQAIKQHGGVPDLIYDQGGLGKEPMIRILGNGPLDVVDKVLRINAALA